MNSPEKIKEMQAINPRPADFNYGIREPRVMKIWPLSVGDQMDVTNSISDSLNEFLQTHSADSENMQDFSALFGLILEMIRKNVKEILARVSEDAEGKPVDVDDVLRNMSNDQLSSFTNLVFEMNYETAVKNFKSLFEKAKGIFFSERPSPLSVPNTDTDSMTFSENRSETEE